MFGLFKSAAQKKQDKDNAIYQKVGSLVYGLRTEIFDNGNRDRETFNQFLEGTVILAGMSIEQMNVYGRQTQDVISDMYVNNILLIEQFGHDEQVFEQAVININSIIKMVPENVGKIMFEGLMDVMGNQETEEPQQEEQTKTVYNGIGFRPSYMTK